MKISCGVDQIKRLAPEEMKALLDKDKKGKFFLLDVRQPEEYEAAHLPGAMLIPLGELEARQEELDRSKKIITYCRSGHRSTAAAIALCGLGFEGVYHLDGGILNWPYETIAGIPEARPELITETSSVRDTLMLAIKLEKGSWDFYMVAGDKVKLPLAKETFQVLASAEDGHMQRLYQQAARLGEEELPPFEKLKHGLKVEHMEGGIEISPALARVDEKFADEMAALEIALEKEFMSYDFYKRTLALVGNAEAKVLLHELAVEERKHADIILQRLSEVVRGR